MKTNLIILVVVGLVVIGSVVFFANQNIMPTNDGGVTTTSTNDGLLPVPDSTPTATGENTQNTNTDIPKTQSYTLAQVATHSNSSSCWSAIRGKVYDITSFIPEHPGGPEKILKLCGKDGTEAFVDKHEGSTQQETQLEKLYIGDLAQ